jgi:hypothetical protein
VVFGVCDVFIALYRDFGRAKGLELAKIESVDPPHAREKRPANAIIQTVRVIVNVHRGQARSHRDL